MAIGELDLIKLQLTLVGLHRALILEHGLLLVLQNLLGDGVFLPRGAVPFQIHLRLRQDVGIFIQCSLGLRHVCLVLAGIDNYQWIAFMDQLAFCVMDGHDQSGHLAGDGTGVHGRDCADGLLINADIAFLCSGRHHADRATAARRPAPPACPAACGALFWRKTTTKRPAKTRRIKSQTMIRLTTERFGLVAPGGFGLSACVDCLGCSSAMSVPRSQGSSMASLSGSKTGATVTGVEH